MRSTPWLRGLLCQLTIAAIALSPAPAWAGRPLDTEDTGTLDPGHAEIELGVDHVRDGGETVWSTKGVFALGLLPGLEARVEGTLQLAWTALTGGTSRPYEVTIALDASLIT